MGKPDFNPAFFVCVKNKKKELLAKNDKKIFFCRFFVTFTVDGKSRFQMPDDSENGIPSCRELIAGNLRHKLLRLRDVRPDIFENITTIANLDTDAISQLPITVEFLPLKENCSYRTLLYRLKGHNIRGFRAPVRITAPEAIHRIVWDCGLGACNSMGYGMVALGRNTSCC